MTSIYIKKEVIARKRFAAVFFAAFVAAFFFSPHSVSADTFKNDFLYKFQSRWSDISVNSAQTKAYILNDVYSRVEEYAITSSTSTLTTVHGGFGTGNTQFVRPQGIATDASDNIYILDSGNNRVVVYNSSFAYTTQWGSAGSGLGQFSNPSSIAIGVDEASGTTYVYIADTDNNRIQRCKTDGTACISFGSLGTANGTFSSPRGIAFDQTVGTVLVADTGNDRVQEIATGSSSLSYMRSIGSYSYSYGGFVNPSRIATDNAGNFYVLDSLNRIQKFNAARSTTPALAWTLPTSGAGIKINTTTMYVTELPTTLQTYATTGAAGGTYTNDIGHPVDMTIDTSGNFYLNNNFTAPSPGVPVIQKFSSQFVELYEWEKTPDFAYTSSGPMGIGSNTGNEVYIANTDANVIDKIDSYGNFVTLPTLAPTPGTLSSPKDVATEATGKYYVADTGNHRILKFDSNGSYTWTAQLPTPTPGGPTPLPGSVASPYGITVASDNKIYVADVGFDRIQRFDANGNYEASWGMFGSADSSTIPQLDTPQGMAIDTSGNIYVADTGNNRIQRFDQNGTLSTRVVWGTYGTQDGKFNEPRNVAVDSANRVFVSEVGNRRIQAFGDATGSAGLTITQTNGTSIKEGTSSSDSSYKVDTYTVQLNTQPSSNVLVNIAVSNATQASVSSPTLTFTPQNWNIPQVETVIPIHDFVASGTHTVVISHKPTSSDPHYQNVAQTSWSDVTVTIDDIDVPGITFSTNTIAIATEGAQLSNAYSVVLNTKPANNSVVTITLTPDSSFAAISPTTMVFTAADGDWNSPRYVSILPLNDHVANIPATHSGIINHTASSTADPQYASPTVQFSNASGNVLVNITDVDHVGVSVSKSSLHVTENSTSDTYTVSLTSKPSSDVNIYMEDASPSAQITLSPSSLVFTSSTWDTPQTVTVAAIHDYIQNPINPRSTLVDFTASSGDSAYNAISIPNLPVTITDSDVSGAVLFKQGGGTVAVTEGGASDTYLIQLSSLPTSNVSMVLTSEDGNATTSASTYTFTPSNWNTPQYATVSAVDNSIADGTHTGLILHTMSSLDTNFNGKTATLGVTITDNDTAGIVVTMPNGVINIAENGPTDVYSVHLSSQPTKDVQLIFNGANQANASPSTLTFTSSNWNVDQQVTLTAIQDYIIEGAMTATMTYTASSTDAKYNGKTASFVVNISDDDNLSPGLSLVETDGSTEVTQKSGKADTYTMALTSKPTANVKIKITSDNTYATTSAGVFWFTPSAWNVPQTVTVVANDNISIDGSKTTVFTHSVSSTDTHYNGTFAPTVTITIHQNVSADSASASNAKPQTCSKTAPYSAPNLFQVNTQQNQATLYFSPLQDNVSYYFIAYGFAPGDMRFGTSFQMGPYGGVIDYTVNMLDAGTTYYFTVRAGNGCATGPWSAAVPATTASSGSSTTRVYYAPATPISSTSSSGGSSGSSVVIGRNLYPGSQGADVRALQQYLNSKGFILAQSGPGSPGNETTYYGNLTAAAVRRFQEAHFQEILSPLGYASGTGIVGPSTRGYIASHP